jgi:hypothetical protein
VENRESGKAGKRESGKAGKRESGKAGKRESGKAGKRESGKAGNKVSANGATLLSPAHRAGCGRQIDGGGLKARDRVSNIPPFIAGLRPAVPFLAGIPSVVRHNYRNICRRGFRRFSRRERSGNIRWIFPERATQKIAEILPALRVALKMARRRRCGSLTDPLGVCALAAPCRQAILNATNVTLIVTDYTSGSDVPALL